MTSRHRDVCVRPNSNWKSLISSRRAASPSPAKSRSQGGTDPTSALAALKDDIVVLWEDPSVQEVLKKRGIRLEDAPGL